MARTATVIFTIVLSLLVLSRSEARVEFQKPENLPTEWHPSTDLPVSDAEPTILLPSDSEEITDIVASAPKDEPAEFHTVDISSMRPFSVPFDRSFRPINRHFHHMPLIRQHHHHFFHFRFPCRHHHRHHQMGPRFIPGREIHQMGPRFIPGREIPYGNDMIMSDRPNFEPIRHHHPSMMFPRRPFDENNEIDEEVEMKGPEREEEEEKMKRPRVEEKDEDVEEKEEREDESGFMFLKSVRKFLNDWKP